MLEQRAPTDQRTTTETPKAADAFRRYVALGSGRTLRKLAADLVEQGWYKTDTTAFNILGRWSAEHHWQDRIAQAEFEEAERMLQEAARLDTDTFLKTSRELNQRAEFTDAVPLDDLVKMRETVRKPQPKESTNVGVNVAATTVVQIIGDDDEDEA